MPNLPYSNVVVAMSVLVCLVTQIGICQASPVNTNVILEFRIKNHGADLANSSSDAYIALVGEIEAQVKASVSPGLSLDGVAVRIRQTDGLCQVYITMSGDAQLVSAWLVLYTQLPIVIGAEKYLMAVAFDSKGQRYKVVTDQVCDVRRVIQPCNETDECTLGGCKLKGPQEITTGNLIVLGYAGAFILALLLIFLFCLYRVAYTNNRRNKKKTLSTSRNKAIQNDAFCAQE